MWMDQLTMRGGGHHHRHAERARRHVSRPLHAVLVLFRLEMEHSAVEQFSLSPLCLLEKKIHR